MRILFCNYEYPPLGGGGGVINALLAEELATRHEVTVLTSLGLGLPPESIVNGVRIVRVPVFFRSQQAAANVPSMLAYLPMGIAAGRRLIRASQYDVINTHFVLPTGPVHSEPATATTVASPEVFAAEPTAAPLLQGPGHDLAQTGDLDAEGDLLALLAVPALDVSLGV